jgi:alkanesulfonate monooxygenase
MAEIGRTAHGIRLFSTCPQSSRVPRDVFLRTVVDVAQWSERGGCTGILVYTDNSLVDPWLLAQAIIQGTDSLSPLVAVQPLYMHPYSAAKMVATLGHLYGRRVHLNLVAGGFVLDLAALDDTLEHDDRYDRLVEYGTIVQRLLADEGPVTFAGAYYRVTNLRLKPALPPGLMPGMTVSGSSTAGIAAAEALGATAIRYPQPAGAYAGEHHRRATDEGIRVGIVARPSSEEAWEVARARFPGDREGALTHQLAMRTSDSVWHHQLSQLAAESEARPSPYWLHPFEHYKTFCPYLVGSYDEVAAEVAHYLERGFRTFILDIPRDPTEFDDVRAVLDRVGVAAA